MKNIEDLKLPADLLYTKEHIWLKKTAGDELAVGISDYAQDQLGEVVYVDLPEAGVHLEADSEFGSIESVKSVNSLRMPVTGVIKAVNGELADKPYLTNADCYGNGWLIRIAPDNSAAADRLLDAAAYKDCLKAGGL